MYRSKRHTCAVFIGFIASYVTNIVLFGIKFNHLENNHLIPSILVGSLANQSALYYNISM